MAPSRPSPDSVCFPFLLLLLLLLALTHQACGIRCVVCEAQGREDACFVKPPPPIECTGVLNGMEPNACGTVHFYTPDRDSRRTLWFGRSCFPINMGRNCMRVPTKNLLYECNHSTSTAVSGLERGCTRLGTTILEMEDLKLVEVCFDTCNEDGCNHAPSTAGSALVVTVALLTTLLLL